MKGVKQSKTLIRAVVENEIAVVRFLLKLREIDVNTRDEDGCTPLILAGWLGHTNIVMELLMHPDIKVNLSDSCGDTALSLATINGWWKTTSLLLGHPDIKINLVDNEGYSPVVGAAEQGHLLIVKMLLAHGAKVYKLRKQYNDEIRKLIWDFERGLIK